MKWWIAVPVVLLPIALADSGRIVDVTVFSNRAEIVRERTVELRAGESTITFDGLPITLEANSLRVSASGVAAALGAIEIVPVVPEERVQASPEMQAAKAEVERLQRRLAEIDASQNVDRQLKSFLTDLGQSTADEQSQRISDGTANLELVRNAYQLMSDELGKLGQRRVDRQIERDATRTELERALERVSLLRPEPPTRSYTVRVGVEAPRAGALSMRLAYLMPGASWEPSYRATLQADGDVLLELGGVVHQKSGEDWSDVKLRLSSASPTQTITPPELAPWPIATAENRVIIPREQPVQGNLYQNVLTLAPGVNDASDASSREAMEVPVADLERKAYALSFDVPGRSAIATDGRDHRVALTSRMLAANAVHRSVPSMDAKAYLTAVTNSPSDLPILGGEMRMFAGDAFLGSYLVEETGPGVEMTLPFGVDNRVEIVRVALPRKSENESSAGRTREVRRAHKTEITNLLDRPITIVVEDRHPVSRETDLKVELVEKETTPGYKPSPRRPGVLIWTLELAAGEKRELTTSFELRHPSDRFVLGF